MLSELTTATVADEFSRHVEAGRLDLPLPGQGRTRARWAALSEIAARDLSLARLCEGHADAVAILAELSGPEPKPASRWGVWAAAPPLLATSSTGRRWRLDGRKPYCSGASSVTHALVTAKAVDGVRLFLVDTAQSGLTRVEGSWSAVGMAASDSLDLEFDAVDAEPLGPPGAYTDRPGFWHGGMGVAACWFGGAQGVAQVLANRAAAVDPHALAHLGTLDSAFAAADALLTATAAAVDADPRDVTGDARPAAMRLRAVCERLADEAVDRVGKALGAGPLCHDPAHARRAADLPVYVRQSHAERDLADLARVVIDRGWAWTASSEDATTGPDVIQRAGTPEEIWQRWPGWSTLPRLDVTDCQRLVVVAAHPDDEVLGVGGLLSMVAGRGVAIHLVAVTDGEGSHPDSPTITPSALAELRLAETERAFAELQVRPSVTRLRLPDSGVSGHEEAVLAAVQAVVNAGDWCLAPFGHDRHPDHEAVSRAAEAAADSVRARFMQFPVWSWHWARPTDSVMPWGRAWRVALDASTLAAKFRAIAAFESQMSRLSENAGDEVVLPPHIIAHFLRSDEVLFA